MTYCGAFVIMMAKPKAALAILIMYTIAIAACCVCFYTNTWKDYCLRHFSTIKPMCRDLFHQVAAAQNIA